MKKFITVVAAISLFSCASITDTKYPSDWAPRTKMSTTCREVSGTYYDYPYDSASRISAAHWAFALNDPAMMADQMMIDPRTVSIYFSEKNTIKIDYAIKGEVVDSRTVLSSDYKCTSDDIELILSSGWGKYGDHYLSSRGYAKTIVRLSRTDGYLIVDSISSGSQAVADFFPLFYQREEWYRFRTTE